MVFDHTAILERLRPYANKGWINRFERCKSLGPSAWIEVVRDFPIDSPKIEQVVHEIVVSMEPKQGRRSLVREEMEKLEMEGKLNMDSPEEAAKWQAKIDEEEARLKREDEEAEAIRKKQVEMDRAHWAKQAKEQKENMAKPTEINLDKPKPAQPPKPLIVDEQVTDEQQTEQQADNTQATSQQQAEDDAPSAPVMPKLRAVSVEGQQVYKDDSKTPARTPLEKLEGMPKDMVEKLAKKGISTVESFQNMEKSEAKATLGTALFKRFEKNFK